MSLIYRSSRIKLTPGQIFWREVGDSNNLPALVFLHGSWEDSRQWQDIMLGLSHKFLCLAPDLLGFGDSIAKTTPTSIEVEVDCLDEFLTSLKLRSVYLIGHSLGGWIAASYALKYPDVVRGVVVISPEGISLKRWQKYNFLSKLLLKHPQALKLWLLALRAVNSLVDEAPPVDNILTYWRNLQKFSTTCQLFLCRSTTRIRSEFVQSQLPWLRMPLLVLQPDRDTPGAIADSQAFAQAAGHSEYKWITIASTDSDDGVAKQITAEIDGFTVRVHSAIEREEGSVW
jgi:pimeloyl-ACP methyl ester carboxylesterase